MATYNYNTKTHQYEAHCLVCKQFKEQSEFYTYDWTCCKECMDKRIRRQKRKKYLSEKQMNAIRIQETINKLKAGKLNDKQDI